MSLDAPVHQAHTRNAKVLWSEGMFLRPQHFQQQDRYLEQVVQHRCDALQTYGWGLTALQIDTALLGLGKLALNHVSGVLPDGTPFSHQANDDAPLIRDIPKQLQNSIIFLGLPLKRPGAAEVRTQHTSEHSLTRYQSTQHQALDAVTENGETSNIDVGTLRLQLLLESEERSGYTCIPLARVIECQTDGHILLDNNFMPTCLDVKIVPRLNAFLKELNGLLHHRAEALSGRLADANRAGVAEIADYLMLQMLNRFEPLSNHLLALKAIHPERLYQELVQMSGELATFTQAQKRPTTLPNYSHDHLQETYAPVIDRLRQQLSTVIEQAAVPLPLKTRKYGIRVCAMEDRSLIGSASFILSVRADLPSEQIRTQVPTHAKLGTVERIRELVNAQMPGIRLTPLAVAPRQIPYHNGAVYFELDPHSDFWPALESSGGFALHLGAEYPGLELAFWAIRH